MTTPDPKAAEVLRTEILSAARREADRLLARAQTEAEAMLAQVRADAERIRAERLTWARAEAERRRALRLATVPVETSRLRAARVGQLLQTIHEAARQRLQARAGFDYREALIGLAVEAIRQMEGDAFVVKLSPPDQAAFGETLASEVMERLNRPALSIHVDSDSAITHGGVIIEAGTGRQIWDNRFHARLERLWPELRRQIAAQTLLIANSDPIGGGA